MARKRKFDDGGVTEGPNVNIDDDTRSRAMAWLKRQQEGGAEETPKVEAKVKSTRARATDTGDETARMVRRAPASTQQLEDRSIPSMEPTVSEKPSLYDRFKKSWPGEGPLSSLGALGGAGSAAMRAGSKTAEAATRLARAGKTGLEAGRAAANPAGAAARRYADVAKMEEEFGKRAADVALGKRAGPAGWRARGEDMIEAYRNPANPPSAFKKGGKAKAYAKGGTVSSASKRGDGIAQRGKTRGKMV